MVSLIQFILARNPDYIYPLGVNVLAALLPVWCAIQVGKARAKAGLKYPNEYFEGTLDREKDKEKYLFNCTQRAHQNLMEQLPTFLISFNICAASFPRLAAALGLGFIVGRVMYHNGYSTRGPSGRLNGARVAEAAGITTIIVGIYGLIKEYMAIA